MKLIKNFRIALRQGYVFRDLKKKKIEIDDIALPLKIKEIQDSLNPATAYETFNPAVFGQGLDFGKSVAVSLFAITSGDKVEALEKSEVLAFALKDAAEVAKNFVLKLICMEAEEEHCELTEPVELAAPAVFENKKIAAKMDFSKIGIKFESDVLTPVNTKFFAVGWLLKKKK